MTEKFGDARAALDARIAELRREKAGKGDQQELPSSDLISKVFEVKSVTIEPLPPKQETTMTENNKTTETKTQSLPALAPLTNSLVLGVEGLTTKNLITGTLVLVQYNTQALIKKGFKPGDIVNTMTEKALTDTVFTPFYMTEKFQLYSHDTGKPKWVCTCDSLDDPRLNDKRLYPEDKENPAEIIPTIMLGCLMRDKPVRISFKKMSGYPAGQKLWSMVYEAAQESKLPLWGMKYKLLVGEAKGKSGDSYFAFGVEKVGKTSDEEMQKAAAMFDGLKSQKKVLDEETPF